MSKGMSLRWRFLVVTWVIGVFFALAVSFAYYTAHRDHYLDVQMPVLDDMEATRAIRADSLNQTTPILAMTANAFDEDREICLAAGMDEHISKPADPEKLYETLLT